MKDSIRVVWRPRRTRPPKAPTAAAIIATASLALAAAAYGSPQSSTSVDGSSKGRESAHSASSHKKTSPSRGETPRQAAQDYAQLLGWAKCMRHRGYPRMPDPKHGTPQPMKGGDVVVIGWGPAAYLVVPAVYDVYSQKFQKACPEIDPVTGNPSH